MRERLVELRQEKEWRRCSKDVEYFLEHYWFISHPAEGKIRFHLWEAQRRGLQHWMGNRYSLTLKARQLGWSTLVSAFAFWLGFFHPDKSIIMISRTERESVSLLRKSKYGYGHLPKWMLERGPSNLVDHQQKIEFSNQSKIASLPSKSDPARGESASLIIVDEWAFLENSEDAWASIEPVADVGGRIIGLSTANGSGEFFHKLWTGAEASNNFFKPFFVPWSGNEQRDQHWYEGKVKSMLPWQLAQEYPNNPEEAFIKSGRTVFDVDALRKTHIPVEPVRGYLHQLRSIKDFQWTPNHDRFAEDPLQVWDVPRPGGVYVIGVDVAEGLEWGDYSSAHVIDVEMQNVVAHWHGHIPADMLGEEMFRLSWWYNDALLGVESNNHGLTTITALRRLGHDRLWRRRRLNTAQSKGPQMEYGFATNKATKPLIIDELARDLRNDVDEGGIQLHCPDTLAELCQYVRDEKGSMGGSPFDDRVMSLAIADHMRQFAYVPEYAPRTDVDFTYNWWSKVKDPEDTTPRPNVIGQHNVRKSHQ